MISFFECKTENSNARYAANTETQYIKYNLTDTRTSITALMLRSFCCLSHVTNAVIYCHRQQDDVHWVWGGRASERERAIRREGEITRNGKRELLSALVNLDFINILFDDFATSLTSSKSTNCRTCTQTQALFACILAMKKRKKYCEIHGMETM